MIVQAEWNEAITTILTDLLATLLKAKGVDEAELIELGDRISKLQEEKLTKSKAWEEYRERQLFRVEFPEGDNRVRWLHGYSELAQWSQQTEQSCRVNISRNSGVWRVRSPNGFKWVGQGNKKKKKRTYHFFTVIKMTDADDIARTLSELKKNPRLSLVTPPSASEAVEPYFLDAQESPVARIARHAKAKKAGRPIEEKRGMTYEEQVYYQL